ncbi:MAG: phage portal protein, partial [Luteolibacter sp.]
MGVILDQFGRKVALKAARAAQWDEYRPWEPMEKKDINDLIPVTDREILRSHARRIYINFGPVKSAINQRSMYAVGRAFVATYRGTDTEFGALASDWLARQFYAIGDVRGGMHDFKTNLFTWSSSIDVDGEVFILLTETDTGYPQYQGIPSHRIANPAGMSEGPLRGGRLQDGIIYWPSGAPKEYCFVDRDGRLIEFIPAENIIHLYDPEFQAQGRGLTALTHCINDCRDMIQSTEWERLAMLQMSSISLIEYNDHGGPDMDDPYTQLAGNTGRTDGVSVQSLDGGTVRYFRSNSGGKLETLVNNRPGNPFLDFHDRLLRSAYAGLNWPYAFYSGHGVGGGTAQRTEIAMAQRAIEDRQDLLFYAAKRIVGYAIAKAQKRGDLPASADWWKWEFSTPPKLTIDDGRVTKELEVMWRIGAANMRDIVSMRGKTLEEHYTERATEVALRKMAAMKAAEEFGVVVDDREMSMLTPNETPSQPAGRPAQRQQEDDSP